MVQPPKNQRQGSWSPVIFGSDHSYRSKHVLLIQWRLRDELVFEVTVHRIYVRIKRILAKAHKDGLE